MVGTCREVVAHLIHDHVGHQVEPTHLRDQRKLTLKLRANQHFTDIIHAQFQLAIAGIHHLFECATQVHPTTLKSNSSNSQI